MIELIIPTLDAAKAQATANAAVLSAGCNEVVPHIVVDTERDGFTRTVNRGLHSVFDADYVVLLNDDVRLSQGWLAYLLEAMAMFEAQFAGPSGKCRTYPQNTGRPGDARRPRLVDHVAGFCMLVHYRELQRCRYGALDQRFRHYGSDVDWQWRFNGRSLWVPGVWCDHELHAPLEPWWSQDQQTLRSIWGGIKL